MVFRSCTRACPVCLTSPPIPCWPTLRSASSGSNRAGRVTARRFPSACNRSTRSCPAAGLRSGRCMRWPAAATARSTARRRRCLPPASRRARRARCSGASPAQDLFAPALAQAGLSPARVIYVEAGDEKSVLACFEEGLRHGGLGAVVAEVARLSMTASRRLQLAAESSGSDRHRHPALAAADRGRRLRAADGLGHPLAGLRAAVGAAAGAGRRTRPLAAGADPLPRRRKRRFRSGGLR